MLWVAGVPLTSPSVLPTTGTASLHGPRHRRYFPRLQLQHLSRRRRFHERRQFWNAQRHGHDQRPRCDELLWNREADLGLVALFRRLGRHGRRTLGDAQWQLLPGRSDQHNARLWRDGRQHHVEWAELPRVGHFRRSQAVTTASPEADGLLFLERQQRPPFVGQFAAAEAREARRVELVEPVNFGRRQRQRRRSGLFGLSEGLAPIGGKHLGMDARQRTKALALGEIAPARQREHADGARLVLQAAPDRFPATHNPE